ncbi:hypothetical protein Daus18300_001689 [Diaporthe australafricana]|uniref:F-box domain-containing protein n=1 Tax=Diaporthe australafricana TaxID=127596 RepID=A0ABR3XV11_9PEZI
MPSLPRGRRSAPTTKPLDSDPGPGPNALIAAGQSAEDSTSRSKATFMHLPAEIHLMISKELTYPDALSLKHTSRYLYGLVDTGVRLKVAWLMERRMLHLDCPNDRKCNLRTDLEFCRGSVTLLMQRRREHVELRVSSGLEDGLEPLDEKTDHGRDMVDPAGGDSSGFRLALDG